MKRKAATVAWVCHATHTHNVSYLLIKQQQSRVSLSVASIVLTYEDNATEKVSFGFRRRFFVLRETDAALFTEVKQNKQTIAYHVWCSHFLKAHLIYG